MTKRANYIHEGALPISIGFCRSAKQYAYEMKKLKIKTPNDWITPEKGAATHRFLNENGHRISLVCVDWKVKRTVTQIAGLVAHEATHVLQDTILQMGEEKPGDEFSAYLVQYITQQGLLYFMRKK
jgi:hypothetical protein